MYTFATEPIDKQRVESNIANIYPGQEPGSRFICPIGIYSDAAVPEGNRHFRGFYYVCKRFEEPERALFDEAL